MPSTRIVIQIDAGLTGGKDVIGIECTFDGVFDVAFHLAITARHAFLETSVHTVHCITFLLEFIQQLVEALIKKETLEGEEVQAIVTGKQAEVV